MYQLPFPRITQLGGHPEFPSFGVPAGMGGPQPPASPPPMGNMQSMAPDQPAARRQRRRRPRRGYGGDAQAREMGGAGMQSMAPDRGGPPGLVDPLFILLQAMQRGGGGGGGGFPGWRFGGG